MAYGLTGKKPRHTEAGPQNDSALSTEWLLHAKHLCFFSNMMFVNINSNSADFGPFLVHMYYEHPCTGFWLLILLPACLPHLLISDLWTAAYCLSQTPKAPESQQDVSNRCHSNGSSHAQINTLVTGSESRMCRRMIHTTVTLKYVLDLLLYFGGIVSLSPARG